MAKSKIIKDLANGDVDTITALKRAKVLLFDLKNDEILNWINYEITGYPSDIALPDYRITSGILTGSYIKGSMAQHMKYTNVPLPLGKMPADQREALLSIQFREGVEALKELSISNSDGSQNLAKEIPADFFPNIANYNNDPYMVITSARVIFGTQCIKSIFSIIENRLLDVLILLEKEFGVLDELDIDYSSKSTNELKTITNKIVVIIYNDNRVTVGNGNKIKDSTIASIINGTE